MTMLQLLAACALLATACAQLNLRLFSPSQVAAWGAACLDGSPSGYYYSASPSATSPGAVIFMQGGGACTSNTGPSSCWLRYNTSLGSSKYWASVQAYDGNVLNRDCSVSPMCDFDLIYIPYCGGDVHSGTRSAPLSADLPFTFAGHRTVAAVVSDLLNTTGIATVPQLLVSGSSAGGLGTFLNADFIAAQLPAVRVRAFPQAGWFFPPVVTFPAFMAGDLWPPATEESNATSIWASRLPPACVDAHNVSYCSSVDGMFAYLTTPMFIAENEADSNQLYVQLGLPHVTNASTTAYIQYFVTLMKQSLQQARQCSKCGGYVPACVDHVGDTGLDSPTTVSGVTLRSVFSRWWNGTASGADVWVQDECEAVPCNPTCVA